MDLKNEMDIREISLQPGSQPKKNTPVKHAEDDEINLLDFFIVLLKHKMMILAVVAIASVASVAAALLLPNIYRSESTIAPSAQEKGAGGLAALGGFGAMIAAEAGITASGSLEQFEVVLKSWELTNSIIKKHDLLPVLFEDSWDTEKKKWNKDPPKYEDSYKKMHGLLKITADKKKNVIKISFESKNPKIAQNIVNYYIVGLSEFLREQILSDASAHKTQLAEQLAITSDPLLRNRLYDLMAKQIEKETLAKVQKYYSFTVIDPAFVPEMKFKPRRAMICVISVVVASFIAVFLAFVLEYVNNLKTRENPERIANIRKYLRFKSS